MTESRISQLHDYSPKGAKNYPNMSIHDVVEYLQNTEECSWNVDTVRSEDYSKNCLFGHLFNMGVDEKHSNYIWNWFEESVSTTYVIYSINDGKNPKYQQETPKQRVLAYIDAIIKGDEMTTYESMDAQMAFYEKEINA